MISASMGGGKSAGKGQGTEKAVTINKINFKGDSNSGPPSPHCSFPEQFLCFLLIVWIMEGMEWLSLIVSVFLNITFLSIISLRHFFCIHIPLSVSIYNLIYILFS